MDIVVIGIGSASSPSTRFRFHQYNEKFAATGHCLNFVYKSDIKSPLFWDALEKADLIINQKCLLGRNYAKRIFALGKPVYFDFDDAIWTRPGKPYSWLTQRKVDGRLSQWLGNATGVMVANQFLAEKAVQYASNVVVVPMALDTKKWKPNPDKIENNDIEIGWNGGPNNLPMLESLNSPLKAFLQQNTHVSMHVFCGKQPCFDFTYDYHPFIAEKEIPFVQHLDIGLLPLEMDEHAHGKSPIKAIQYMACGVPVVGNVNQGGSEFLTASTCMRVTSKNEWISALKQMTQDKLFRENLVRNALRLVHDRHSLDRVFVELEGFLMKIN